MDQPKAQGGDGYVRMLQSKEEVAKRMGEKSSQSGFDTVIRLLATAKTERRAEEISNNMIIGLSLFKDSSSNWFQTRRIFFIDSINDWWFKFNFKKRMLDCRFFGIGERTTNGSAAFSASTVNVATSLVVVEAASEIEK